jgi:hypothetical protein
MAGFYNKDHAWIEKIENYWKIIKGKYSIYLWHRKM